VIVLVYGNIKEEIFMKQNFDFAGSTIFYYDSYDVMDEAQLYFYGVEFAVDSMKEFNDKCGGCSLDIHGDFIIDDKSGTQILHTDIADVWLDLQKQK